MLDCVKCAEKEVIINLDTAIRDVAVGYLHAIAWTEILCAHSPAV
jgi:hypothetical protein